MENIILDQQLFLHRFPELLSIFIVYVNCLDKKDLFILILIQIKIY
jgi:hypothetical protein